jgi:hypothetical protein
MYRFPRGRVPGDLAEVERDLDARAAVVVASASLGVTGEETAMSEAQMISVADGLWTVYEPDFRMLGLKLGTRMTIVRLPQGTLVLHSPIAISSALASAIEALGQVGHIVAPNLYHHVYAGEAQKRWPEAKLHGASGLNRKRRDLRVDSVLGKDPVSADWQGALTPVTIHGCLLGETVLVHAPSRTVISADLFENFLEMDHTPTRLYLQASGVWQKPGWGRFLRVLYRDHRAARQSVDALLEHDFEGAIIAHGTPVKHGAKDAVRQTFQFLRA